MFGPRESGAKVRVLHQYTIPPLGSNLNVFIFTRDRAYITLEQVITSFLVCRELSRAFFHVIFGSDLQSKGSISYYLTDEGTQKPFSLTPLYVW